MVEIILGRNIKANHHKFIAATTNNEFTEILSQSEQNLLPSIKKQTLKDGIVEFRHTYFVCRSFAGKTIFNCLASIGWQGLSKNQKLP